MCGILGFYSSKASYKNSFDNALNTLLKRGPDNTGFFKKDNLYLGHTRLSIIDTSTKSNQPFFTKDNRYVIVYNGELYNFKELREELEQKGMLFTTVSDTEVVLYAYVLYGKDCLNKFNGFFSFTIFDTQTQSLILARDKLGIKPFYYYEYENDFAFSSEQKALLTLPINKSIDKSSIRQYFQYSYIPDKNTGFAYIKELSPGSFLEIDCSKSSLKIDSKKYYSIKKSDSINQVDDFSATKKQLKEHIEKSVRKRLYADVDLGCFLSGGIDSSIISIEAIKHKKNLNTFSLGYKNHQFFDETNYAQLVADKIGSNHHALQLTNEDVYHGTSEVLKNIDQPFSDSSTIAFYLISEYTKKKVDVVLSGDGADELFAGYNKHWALHRSFNNRIPNFLSANISKGLSYFPKSRNNRLTNTFRQLSRYANALGKTDIERYFFLTQMLNTPEKIFTPSLIEKTAQELFSRNNFLENKYLPNVKSINDYLLADVQFLLPGDMLRKVDSMSMANSLEVRVPFLDTEIVEYVFSLPSQMKINNTSRKFILREAYKKELPDEVYKRSKKGFEVPLKEILSNYLFNEINNHWLSEDFIRNQNVFNWEAIKTLKQDFFKSKRSGLEPLLWSLVVFNNWWNKYQLKLDA